MLAEIRRGLGSSVGLAVVALTAVGAGLRFATLGDQSLWYDEYLSQTAASGPLSEVMPHIERAESSPPVYYYVAWAWTHAFGQGDFVLHSLSALAGTLAIPLAYAAGRELASRRAGVILAALVATSPWLIWYSQEARSYGLLMLLSAASLYFFARARKEPSAWALGGWSVASALALATHYFAGALVTVEAAWLLIGARGRRGAVAARSR
jgi:mannosyltransferase